MESTYRYRPFRFFFLANLITWLAMLIASYFSYQPDRQTAGVLQSVFIVIGVLAPFGVAMVMIFLSGSGDLKRDFLSRLFNLKRIKLRNIPFILFTLPAAASVSILLSSLIGQTLDQFHLVKGAIYSAGAMPAPVILFGAALFEELGWKGYGMDSLRSKFNFFQASLIFGLIWIFWHIPTFFLNGFYMNLLLKTNPWFVVNYCVSVAAMGFLTSWMWYKNRGSILAGVLVHASANFQGIFQMGQIAKCIETVLLIVVVIVIVAANKRMYFSSPSSQIGHYEE